MTRRGVPSVSPSDLRDHATPERIQRIWEQVEADLPAVERTTVSPPRWMVGVLAAVVASSAGGLLLGKLIWDRPLPVQVAPAPTVASATHDPSRGLFAAGTRQQTFPLPGGGRLVLSPGATVEVVHQHGDDIALRLVHGEATIDTADLSSRQLVALLAGDTVLSTDAGGVVRVRRNANDLDVSVTGGHVDVHSPDGARRLEKGQHLRAVPLRIKRRSARVVSPPPRGSVHVPAKHETASPAEAAKVPEALPTWQERNRAGDAEVAFNLLSEQPGGIDGAIQAASSADELWEIHDVAIRQDPGAAYRALTRVADAFPGDASAQLAAYKLGNYYRRAGQHELANKWFSRAAESVEGALAEDALCKQFRTAPNEEEALRFAQEYLERYPDGRCKDEAERLVAGDSSDIEEEPAERDSLTEQEPDAGVPN